MLGVIVLREEADAEDADHGRPIMAVLWVSTPLILWMHTKATICLYGASASAMSASKGKLESGKDGAFGVRLVVHELPEMASSKKVQTTGDY